MNKQQLNAEIMKDIPLFMDKLFGIDNWLYDETEQLYIAHDPKYQGPDFGFIAISADGSFFTGVRPKNSLQ
jgi:hypothetical protein